MADLYKDKYRISSARLANYDYGSPGFYFVTICTKNRECFFGDIADQKPDDLQLTEIGKIARQYWLDIPKHFPFVELDEFVVMPNHVHGILFFNRDENGDNHCRDAINRVSTTNVATKKKPGGITGQHNPMLHENLGRVIRWYKGRCSFEIRKFNPDFAWQPRFYDHIIRSSKDLQNIRQYIIDNPSDWDKDRNNPRIVDAINRVS